MGDDDLIRPGQAGKHGFSRTGLYRHVRAGRLERISRGLYRPADAPVANVDYLEIAARQPASTLCLSTGLALYDLTDAIPHSLDVALPRGTRAPVTEVPVAWHHFDRNTFAVGRSTVPIDGSTLTIGLYSAERCIVDTFRLRGIEGYETGRDALRAWLQTGGKPADLMALARQLPRATRPLQQALEFLT